MKIIYCFMHRFSTGIHLKKIINKWKFLCMFMPKICTITYAYVCRSLAEGADFPVRCPRDDFFLHYSGIQTGTSSNLISGCFSLPLRLWWEGWRCYQLRRHWWTIWWARGWSHHRRRPLASKKRIFLLQFIIGFFGP